MAAKVGRAEKTRDRILSVALDLLNAEGEQALSAVDIAAALGISPGHLYYHFKGKGEIAAALFDRHVEEMAMIMDAARRDTPSLDTLWTHVQIMLEEIHDLRFFYRNLDALIARDTDLGAKLRRLLGQLRETLRVILTQLQRTGTLPNTSGLSELIAESMVTAFVYRLNLEAIESPNAPPREHVARAALQVMTLVASHAAGGPAPGRQKA